MVEGVGNMKAFIKVKVPHCEAAVRQMEVTVKHVDSLPPSMNSAKYCHHGWRGPQKYVLLL